MAPPSPHRRGAAVWVVATTAQALGQAAASAAATDACRGELLHNGICLPPAWPPNRSAFAPGGRTGLIEPPSPGYLSSPPDVINISTGRQLFVDTFLVDGSATTGDVAWRFFAAEYDDDVNPVITFDRPWERVGNTYARPFSGGVSWDAASGKYRMWYGCGDSVKDDSNLALCLATSDDGIKWDKPNQQVVPDTNIVVNTPLRSNNVWRHPGAADPARRFVLADTNGPTAPGSSYWLWGSPDGVSGWKPILNVTGKTADRGTAFHDPFRKRWVFSIKGYRSDVNAEYGRHRMYWETPDDDPFGPGVRWSPSDPVLWAAADTLDQPGVVPTDHAEVYTLDVSPFESLHVAYYTILRGKGVEAGGGNRHPEYDAVYLGFSRNGFDISRPPADEPTGAPGCALAEGRRRPFAGMTPSQRVGTGVGNSNWNYGGVQSVTGSPVLAPDNTTLLFYFGGQAGFSVSCVGPGSQTGVARLRRDGFAALETGASSGGRGVGGGGGGGSVTTRPLATAPGRVELFVNFNGSVTAEVLDADGGAVLLGPSQALVGDETTARVQWPGVSRPLAVAGVRPFRVRFTLGPSTRLYAFWTAEDACGASFGFAGGGGPGAPDGVDTRGRC